MIDGTKYNVVLVVEAHDGKIDNNAEIEVRLYSPSDYEKAEGTLEESLPEGSDNTVVCTPYIHLD